MGSEVQPIISPGSIWVEDTYHNTLPTAKVTAPLKKKESVPQSGKSTLLQRIAGGVNQFLGQVKLPPVTFEHEVAPKAQTMTYLALALFAFVILKKKR